MPMDLSRIIQAAAEAALQDQATDQSKDKGKDRRKGLTAPRALLIGAGLFTVGRLVVGSRGRDMLEEIQERLLAYESEHFGEPPAEYEEEEPEGEYDGDEEPEAEYDEEEEPEGDYDEDEEPEGEYDEDEELEDEYDEEDEPEAERPRRRASSATSRNGRH